jgi:membrane-bound lytic murein transglycosylase B
MKRTFSRLLLVCAVLASAALAVAAPVVHAAVSAYRFAKDWLVTGFKLFASTETVSRPTIARVQAKAFVQRIMKRERPTVTPGWRMCPSI